MNLLAMQQVGMLGRSHHPVQCPNWRICCHLPCKWSARRKFLRCLLLPFLLKISWEIVQMMNQLTGWRSRLSGRWRKHGIRLWLLRQRRTGSIWMDPKFKRWGLKQLGSKSKALASDAVHNIHAFVVKCTRSPERRRGRNQGSELGTTLAGRKWKEPSLVCQLWSTMQGIAIQNVMRGSESSCAKALNTHSVASTWLVWPLQLSGLPVASWRCCERVVPANKRRGQKVNFLCQFSLFAELLRLSLVSFFPQRWFCHQLTWLELLSSSKLKCFCPES